VALGVPLGDALIVVLGVCDGVGVLLALALVLPVTDAVGVALSLVVDVVLGVGVGVALLLMVGVGVALSLMVGVLVAVMLAVGVLLAVRVLVGVALADGSAQSSGSESSSYGDGSASHVAGSTQSSSPLAVLQYGSSSSPMQMPRPVYEVNVGGVSGQSELSTNSTLRATEVSGS
jgi:hypothetical protein